MFDLREVRRDKRMTQKELAKRVGCVRGHISSIENGRVHPSVEMAKSIAKVLEFEWTKFYEDEKILGQKSI